MMTMMIRNDDSIPDQDVRTLDIALITNACEARPSAGAGANATPPATWIEHRYVKRRGKIYGPYAYRRWRSGGKLRAKYLGKVNHE
jgi:hypothetical protein